MQLLYCTTSVSSLAVESVEVSRVDWSLSKKPQHMEGKKAAGGRQTLAGEEVSEPTKHSPIGRC